MSVVRNLATLMRRTPLHPQWLLGPRRLPAGIKTVTGRLLDIGAADRWLQSQLSNDVRYIALDYPATGRDLYGAKPDVFADGARLPFPDGSFDAVACLEVLEHVRDPARVVHEISRVLKPGGRAWISMPFLYPLHDAPFDFQRYTEFGLRRDCEGAGLKVTSIRQTGHAVRSAGLLTALAIAGGAYSAYGWVRWLLLPLATLLVLLINTLAWAFSLVWPDWNHLGSGHELQARKP